MPEPHERGREMRDIKRYDLNTACDGESGRCLTEMEPRDDGDYVLWTDYAAQAAAIATKAETLGPFVALAKAVHNINGDHLLHPRVRTAKDCSICQMLNRAENALVRPGVQKQKKRDKGESSSAP